MRRCMVISGRCAFAITMIASVILMPVSTYALSEHELNLHSQNDIYFYDPCEVGTIDVSEEGDGPTETKVFVVSGDNASTILSNLINAGYSPTAAAAILGNLKAESSFNPLILEGGSTVGDDFVAWSNGSKTFSGGFGIAQWTSAGRVQGLQNYANSKGLKVTSLQAQTGYLIQELSSYNLSPSSLNSLSLEEATFKILRYYEGPAKVVYDHSKGVDNDYIPNSFSDLSPTATKDAYNVWKTRFNNAQALSGLEPTDPSEIIIDNELYEKVAMCGPEYLDYDTDDSGPDDNDVIEVLDDLSVISYYQCDPRWGELMFGSEGVNGTVGSTICESGCGPTSFASIAANMGLSVNPKATADVAGKAGMYVAGAGSSNNITRVLANEYGMTYKDVNVKSVNEINTLLSDGYMVHIAGKGSMPYSSGGHYVAIVGVDGKGNWIVADPGHKSALVATYSPNTIVSGAHAGGAVKK